MRLLPVAVLLTLPVLGRAALETFVFDPAHSSVAFSVRHFLANVPGQFARVAGEVRTDPTDPTRNSVEATVEVASVWTQAEKRDEHLRSPDFFDAAQHPTATFRSTRWVAEDTDTFAVTGRLSLHGVEREITVPVRYLGRTTGNRGATLSGWQARFPLRRSDFGVGKPEKSIGDDVEVIVNVEARLAPAAAAP